MAGLVWQNVNQPYFVDYIPYREFYINSRAKKNDITQPCKFVKM